MKNKKIMIHHIPITKARVNLGQVVRRVRLNKEYFILEKDGIPIAGIMGADELEDYLELRDPKVRASSRESTPAPMVFDSLNDAKQSQLIKSGF